MRKYEVLKAVVILQAICMVVLAAVVVAKLVPLNQRPADEPDTETHGESEEDAFTVATVGGETVTNGQLKQELYEKYADEVLRTMMVHRAIDLEAQSQGLTVTEEEQSAELASVSNGYASEDDYFQVMQDQLGMSRDEVLEDLHYRLLLEKIAMQTVTITDQELESFMEEHQGDYGDRLQLHLRWIVTATKKEADQVVARLEAGEDFEQLAKIVSIDSFSADDGGDLGMIDANDPFYNKEILDAAGRLQTGEMAGPFEVDAGFAVIQLAERQVTKGPSEEEIRGKIAKQLALAKAKSLHDIEEDLLDKYDAVVIPKIN